MARYQVTLKNTMDDPRGGPRGPVWFGGPPVLIEADNVEYVNDAGTLVAVKFTSGDRMVATFNGASFVSAVVEPDEPTQNRA